MSKRSAVRTLMHWAGAAGINVHYLEAMAPLDLAAFHAVDDAEELRLNADPDAFRSAAFSCGLFEFVKPTAVSSGPQ